MRVSWLVPVRDGRPWLGRAVASALAECDGDDEIVVVDDGSRDDPAGVLPADARVRLLTRPPLGIAAALEAGRATCRGRWIARLDADDEVVSGRIGAQLAALEADPGLAAVGGQGVPVEPFGPGMRRLLDWVHGCDPHAELLVEAPLLHPATTLRADALGAVGGWRTFDGPEDYDLWLRLVDAGWRITNLPAPVVRLRDRPDRLTRIDPRYRRAAFFPLKASFLAPRLGSRVAVWGGGPTSRPWLGWLEARGTPAVAVLDVHGGSTRRGVPVLPREAVSDLRFDHLLVAVGAAGARAEIRQRIRAARPELVEGRDWWAVA